SGVDPVARDGFWELIVDLSRGDGVTIFITTHFMNEAQRCDRISLMHAGRILASDTPAAIAATRGTDSLEEAFVAYLEEASGSADQPAPAAPAVPAGVGDGAAPSAPREDAARHAERLARFSLARLLSFSAREATELRRDPVRLTLALLGSLVLMLVMGYGITMDVEDLHYAVLDHDRSLASDSYTLR